MKYSLVYIVIILLEDHLRNSLVIVMLPLVCYHCYDNRFTPDLPIDVVYTWVNGSDPILLGHLEELKKQEKLK